MEIHAPFTHGETMAYAPLGLCAAADARIAVATGQGGANQFSTCTVVAGA
ncbi:hypothetical protein [Pseudonocardia sp. GCM10023141]